MTDKTISDKLVARERLSSIDDLFDPTYRPKPSKTIELLPYGGCIPVDLEEVAMNYGLKWIQDWDLRSDSAELDIESKTIRIGYVFDEIQWRYSVSEKIAAYIAAINHLEEEGLYLSLIDVADALMMPASNLLCFRKQDADGICEKFKVKYETLQSRLIILYGQDDRQGIQPNRWEWKDRVFVEHFEQIREEEERRRDEEERRRNGW